MTKLVKGREVKVSRERKFRKWKRDVHAPRPGAGLFASTEDMVLAVENAARGEGKLTELMACKMNGREVKGSRRALQGAVVCTGGI